MPDNHDVWGNLRGEPCRIIEEAHGSNYIKILIYKADIFFAYGFQMRVGSIMRQKAANISGAIYLTAARAKEAAGNEIESICKTNRNSKKYFEEFSSKIRYTVSELFEEIL
jgi:hypothetical protein